MKNFVLSTISEDEVEDSIRLLKNKDLLVDVNCVFCNVKIDNGNFGGYIPVKKRQYKKVSIFCDKLKCKMDAFTAIRKYNGNGSPIIEDE